MLFTNDGDLARALLHPSSLVLKEYQLEVKGNVDERGLGRFRESIQIGDTWTRPAEVVRTRASPERTALSVTLHEGKNRQIRRLAEHAGYEVLRLERQRFAGLSARGLRPGQWRHLTAAELKALRELAHPR
jgi:23S rRNA pseudouridine2605 synthase